MTKAKKIYVNKNDEAALVIERIIDAEAEEIVLSIPKFSRFAQSESNFHLLKKEMEALDKRITIESVDDKVIDLAASSEIPATNPFFADPGRQFADIVPHTQTRRARINPVLVDSRRVNEPEIETVSDGEMGREVVSDYSAETPEEIGAEIESRFGPAELRRRFGPRNLLIMLCVLVFSGALTFIALFILPKADISIVVQKKNFNYASAILVDKNIRNADSSGMRVPGQIFSERRNMTLIFPASGKKQVTKKAVSQIKIYNAYSSAPQKLVASTRFVTPDGKIFRLTSPSIVPGAKIENGAIVPSSIEAVVTADKAGAEYNIAATRFDIPGFAGTPREKAFYGESVAPASGGYVGELAYPTDEDIRKAKLEIAKVLESGARAAVQSKVPADFKMVENAFLFNIVKQTVNPDVNEAGQFSIFAEAEVSLMAFREPDMFKVLEDRAIKEAGDDYHIKDKTLTYGASKVDMSAGRMSVAVDYKSLLAKNLDVADLKSKMLRKPEPDLKAMLLGTSGLESAKVTLWPFWVRSVPSDNSKVTVSVD